MSPRCRLNFKAAEKITNLLRAIHRFGMAYIIGAPTQDRRKPPKKYVAQSRIIRTQKDFRCAILSSIAGTTTANITRKEIGRRKKNPSNIRSIVATRGGLYLNPMLVNRTLKACNWKVRKEKYLVGLKRVQVDVRGYLHRVRFQLLSMLAVVCRRYEMPTWCDLEYSGAVVFSSRSWRSIERPFSLETRWDGEVRSLHEILTMRA
jgi:hypothetical protein